MLRASDFDYELPDELIAQQPALERAGARLLHCNRVNRHWNHRRFVDLLDLLRGDDVLILNDSRVIPARLWGRKAGLSGRLEIVLTEPQSETDWWVLMRPGKRVRAGTRVELFLKGRVGLEQGRVGEVSCEVLDKNEEGHCLVRFHGTPSILDELDEYGEIPLPPYIGRPHEQETDRERYQTVYCRESGSIAAPTAGLHFTKEFLKLLGHKGVEFGYVTLHVGLGTFSPVKVDDLTHHRMHEERIWLPEETSRLIHQAKRQGRRIVAVGTTSLRVLESWALQTEGKAYSGRTRLFIYPPYEFRVVDALITNFHLPQSTLLMLVSAFGSPGDREGRDWMLNVYKEAVRERYRFFSYGDAMFVEDGRV